MFGLSLIKLLNFTIVCLRMLKDYGRQRLGGEVFAGVGTKPGLPDITPQHAAGNLVIIAAGTFLLITSS